MSTDHLYTDLEGCGVIWRDYIFPYSINIFIKLAVLSL